jgi:hypothetical protein
MSSWKKMERTKNAWQRRAASIYIHVLLTRRNAIRYLNSTETNVLEMQIDYFSHTCLGGFDAEKLSGIS